MKCQKVVSHKSKRGEPAVCGRSGTQYLLKGGISAVPTTLCERHRWAFAMEGYSLDPLVMPSAPPPAVDPITQPCDNVLAPTNIVNLTNEEPVQAQVPAAEPTDAQQHDDLESSTSIPADGCGDAAKETHEPGASAAPPSPLAAANSESRCDASVTSNANEDEFATANADTEETVVRS